MRRGSVVVAAGALTEECAASASAPINTASRTLEVLSAFDGSRAVLGVSEIALRAGVPKSTAHRLLSVLTQHGFVKREGNRYRLAEHLFELGSHALGLPGLRDRAVPYLVELHHATLETVHLAVLHDNHVLYVEKIFGHQAPPCPTTVGGRNPAHCTALGKAILSRSTVDLVERVLVGPLPLLTRQSLRTPEAVSRHLRVARDDGVAVEIEECRTGLACISAPIIDRHTGQAVAALSISSPTSRFDGRRFAARLRRAADELSR
jgi:DNA-binding IclR family transcriptional regulator